MQGNTFGRIFRVTTWGESHGPALGAIIDGCPAGVLLSSEDFTSDMALRQGGNSEFATPRKEADRVSIESGVFEGKTTGTPIALRIENKNTNSKDYESFRSVPRPGHADLTTLWKHSHRDHRGGGRSSARETAARVATAVVAKKILDVYGVRVFAYLSKIKDLAISSPFADLRSQSTAELQEQFSNLREIRNKNSLRSLAANEDDLLRTVLNAREAKDSLGGEITAFALNLPRGLGEPIFDKLNAVLAHAYFSLPAVVSLDIGGGMAMSESLGSEIRDSLQFDSDNEVQFQSNSHGGLLGGMSTGMPLWSSVRFHAPTSIPRSVDSINLENKQPQSLNVEGRHDSFPLPRAIPVVEAMLALTLVDAILLNKAQKL